MKTLIILLSVVIISQSGCNREKKLKVFETVAALIFISVVTVLVAKNYGKSVDP